MIGIPALGKFDAPLVNMDGEPLSPQNDDGKHALTVGVVLADAVLSRKSDSRIGQMAAFTLAQKLYQAGRGAPLPFDELERLHDCGGDVWTQLGDDLSRYANQQPNLLVVGQVQVWLSETRRSLIKPDEFDNFPVPKAFM